MLRWLVSKQTLQIRPLTICFLFWISFFVLQQETCLTMMFQQQRRDPIDSHLHSFSAHVCESGDSKCRQHFFGTSNDRPGDRNYNHRRNGYNKERQAALFEKLKDLRNGKGLPREFGKNIIPEKLWPDRDNHTCLVSNASDSSSQQPLFEWQRRAPYVVVLGAQKGGTRALTTYFWQHPQFVKSDKIMEVHFFDSPSYQTTRSGIPQRANQLAYGQSFQKVYNRSFFDQTTGAAKAGVYAFDTTPYYLVQSDFVPQGLQCVAPWAKWIALVRNPVTRVESHYHMWVEKLRSRGREVVYRWNNMIQHDIALLQYTGVLQDTVPFEEYSGSIQEYKAWKRYLRTPLSSGKIVGRGLYAIQIQHYLNFVPKEERPEDKLLVILSEALLKDTQATYDRILNFLDLPPHTLTNTSAVHVSKKNHNKTKVNAMPNHCRQQLQDLYRPYNQRLFKMLGWTRESEPFLWNDSE